MRSLGFGGVALHGVGAGQSEPGQCAPWKVPHHSPVVDELLKFRCRRVAVVQHEIGFSTQIDRAQKYTEVLVGWPSSIVLASFNSSTARFGSLRSKATAARMVGSQYLWTSVSSGNVLSSSAASFSAPAVSPARARASAAIARTSRFGASFNAAFGVGPRLLPVSRFHFAQRRCCLIALRPSLWRRCARRNPSPGGSVRARSSASRTNLPCPLARPAAGLPCPACPSRPRPTAPSCAASPFRKANW